MSHPARFSPEIIDVLYEILVAEYPDYWMGRPILHDPWAGTGERLRQLAERAGFGYSGTEIEAPFIEASGIMAGNSVDPDTYLPARSGYPFVIVTSITYPNGVADYHRVHDDSRRYSYRVARAKIVGRDEGLHEDNMGRYGYRSTKRGGNSSKRSTFWDIAERTVPNWKEAELVLLNCSDFPATRGGQVEIEPFVADCKDLLHRHGWTDQTDIPVGTKRMKDSPNRERADAEYIIVGRKP